MRDRNALMLGLGCVLSLLFLKAPQQSTPREAPWIWLFSWDARFVTIDLDQERLVDAGNLWYMDIRDVDGVIPWPTDEYLFLVTKSWKLLGLTNPNEEEWERRGLAVLVRNSRGGLLFRRLIPPPAGSTLTGGKTLKIGEANRLFLGWRGVRSGKEFSTSYDSGLNEVGRLPGFRVNPYSCLAPDGQVLTPQLGEPRLKFIWDLRRQTVRKESYFEIDQSRFANVTPLSVASDCVAVIWASREPRSPEATLVLYNLATDERISTIPVTSFVIPHYLPKRRILLTERYESTPLSENASRRHMLGTIDVHSDNGNRLGTITVPADGHLVAISPDETLGFYLSPFLLSVIDLEAGRIRFQVDVPFTDAKIGWFGSLAKEK